MPFSSLVATDSLDGLFFFFFLLEYLFLFIAKIPTPTYESMLK